MSTRPRFRLPWGTERNRKLLEYMIKNEKRRVPSSEIQEKLGIDKTLAAFHLKNMEADGLIVSKKVGRVRYFRFNSDCFWAEDFKALLKKIQGGGK